MAQERRGDPASKSPRDKPTGGRFHAEKKSFGRSLRRKVTGRKASRKSSGR